MQDVDGLIAQCFELNPRARKRLREVAWEEIWAAGGDNVPDFSTLPKEIWGMIAARCEVSRATLTALMSLNKKRISAVAWSHFRFSPSWNWYSFTRRMMVRIPDSSGIEDHWLLFGFAHASGYLAPVEKYASPHISALVYSGFKREYFALDVWHVAMTVITTHADILICITKLLSTYRPEIDCKTLCVLFEHLGYTVVGKQPQPALRTELTFVPNVLDALIHPLTNIHVALGYYNAYREYAREDYGVRLPKIELKGD
jgi:hypothetical protein